VGWDSGVGHAGALPNAQVGGHARGVT